MENMMQPLCQLEDYQFSRLTIEWLNPDKDAEIPFRPRISYKLLSHKNDPEVFKVEMRVGIVSEQKPPVGYTMDLGIGGQIRVPNCKDDEQRAYIATLNGLTLLYGVLRGHVAALTGCFPGGKFILPTVMMQDVIAGVRTAPAKNVAAPEQPRKNAQKKTSPRRRRIAPSTTTDGN